jgi:hypothetical protein
VEYPPDRTITTGIDRSRTSVKTIKFKSSAFRG